MSDWTPEAIAAEEAMRAEQVERGQCPDSGLPIRDCILCDICGCWDHEDIRAQVFPEFPGEDE